MPSVRWQDKVEDRANRLPVLQRVTSTFTPAMLEAEHLAALRIDSGHHVPDRAVFSGGVHRLEDQQDCMAVGCIEQLLSVGVAARLLGVANDGKQ
jgi:hypothetical protein